MQTILEGEFFFTSIVVVLLPTRPACNIRNPSRLNINATFRTAKGKKQSADLANTIWYVIAQKNFYWR
jgi:hypothetical protein